MNKSLFYGGISGIVESYFSHPIDFYKLNIKNPFLIINLNPILFLFC